MLQQGIKTQLIEEKSSSISSTVYIPANIRVYQAVCNGILCWLDHWSKTPHFPRTEEGKTKHSCLESSRTYSTKLNKIDLSRKKISEYPGETEQINRSESKSNVPTSSVIREHISLQASSVICSSWANSAGVFSFLLKEICQSFLSTLEHSK